MAAKKLSTAVQNPQIRDHGRTWQACRSHRVRRRSGAVASSHGAGSESAQQGLVDWEGSTGLVLSLRLCGEAHSTCRWTGPRPPH